MGLVGIGIIVIMSILGATTFIKLISLKKRFEGIIEKSNKALSETSSEAMIYKQSGTITVEKRASLEIGQMNESVNEYNDAYLAYSFWTQMISLFPLGGLLGTVWGLIPGLKTINEGDFSILFSSLGTALYTTLCGLGFAILLKVAALSASKRAEQIELIFESRDRVLNDLLNFDKINK